MAIEPIARDLQDCESCESWNGDASCERCKHFRGSRNVGADCRSEDHYRESRESFEARTNAAIAESEKKMGELAQEMVLALAAEKRLAESEKKLAESEKKLAVYRELFVDDTGREAALPCRPRKLGVVMDEFERLKRLERDHPEIVERAVKAVTCSMTQKLRSMKDQLDLLVPPPCDPEGGLFQKCVACGHMLVLAWPRGEINLFKAPPVCCPTCMMAKIAVLESHNKALAAGLQNRGVCDESDAAKLEVEVGSAAIDLNRAKHEAGELKKRVKELEEALRSFGIPVPCEVRPDVHRDPDDDSGLYTDSVEHRAELGKWLQLRFPKRWSSVYNAFGTVEAAMKFLDEIATVLGRNKGPYRT